MSLNIEGKSCPVCHAYLFDEDDVVFCPVCGAPHHRDCYAAIGHCGLEEFHGTDKQYDLVQKAKKKVPKEEIKIAYHTEKKESENSNYVRCGMCGEIYDKNEKSCPKCNTANVSHLGSGFANFDFLGGVPADMDLGEGVTADEAKRFVSMNPHRYIPKFAAMANGTKASWNWLAFFFPCGWLLSRKMYKNGIFAGLLTIAFTLLSFPFQMAINQFDTSDASNYMQYAQMLSEALPKIRTSVLAAMLIGTVFMLILRFVIGIFGDYFYRNHTIATVKHLKDDDLEYLDDNFRRKGGVSLTLLLIGFFAVEYLPSFIFMLLK